MSLEVKLDGPTDCELAPLCPLGAVLPLCLAGGTFVQPGDTHQRLRGQGLRLLHRKRECEPARSCCAAPSSHRGWQWSNTRPAAELLCTARSSQRDGTRLMVLKCFPGLQCSRLNQHLLWEGRCWPQLWARLLFLPTGSTWYQPLTPHDLINFIVIHPLEILHVLLVKISQFFLFLGFFCNCKKILVLLQLCRFLLKWSFLSTD